MGRPGEGDWWNGAYNQVSGKKDLGKSVSDSAKKNGGVGWDGGSQDSWMAKGQTNRTYYDKNGQQRDMGSLDPFGEHGNAFRQDPKAAKQQDMLRQAGIGPDQAYHLAHAAGITNVNSKSDIKSIIKAHDAAHVSHSEMESYVAKNGKKDKGDGDGDPGPEETSDPLEQSSRHEELANTPNTYPGLTNAQDSYNSAFNQATEAGRDMESGDYLRQRADDKREWVTDKYMPYLQTKNELARHEGNYAAKNAIHEMQDLEVADYTDPMDWYNKMKDDLEDVG
jgi:hypothetical protein